MSKPKPSRSKPAGTEPAGTVAERALREADERRRQASRASLPEEVGGRDGPDPVRYGDWEKNGLISDF